MRISITKLLWLVAGNLTVILPERRRLLEFTPGDRVEVPAGTLHASQAGPEGALPGRVLAERGSADPSQKRRLRLKSSIL